MKPQYPLSGEIMEEETIEFCTSCGRGLIEEGCVVFRCPNCGTLIARCTHCREQSIPYTCPNCGFEGP